MKYHTVFLFGAPGAGKGTQGRILGKVPNFFYCSCGDVFRSLSLDSPIGRAFIKYSSRGKLVPDEPTVELWRQFVDNSTRIGQFRPKHDTLVLDGIPRNVRQAEMLKGSLDVRAIFYLRCQHMDQMVERLRNVPRAAHGEPPGRREPAHHPQPIENLRARNQSAGDPLLRTETGA